MWWWSQGLPREANLSVKELLDQAVLFLTLPGSHQQLPKVACTSWEW